MVKGNPWITYLIGSNLIDFFLTKAILCGLGGNSIVRSIVSTIGFVSYPDAGKSPLQGISLAFQSFLMYKVLLWKFVIPKTTLIN